MNLKQMGAERALELIKPNQIIGLGGGETIRLLAKALAATAKQTVGIVTLSDETKQYCLALDLNVLDFSEVTQIDITFDGADRVSRDWLALKTNGGIQTQEKLTAALSKRYVLIVDEGKFQDQLIIDLPICCEILPLALPVLSHLAGNLDANVQIRPGQTQFGNLLVDLMLPINTQVAEILTQLNQMPGLVSHAIFDHEITDVVVTSREQVTLYSKK